MSKKLTIATKPTRKTASADDWVGTGGAAPVPGPAEKPKRLTLDLDPALHSRIKAACAIDGVKMVERIRDMLETEFPATP